MTDPNPRRPTLLTHEQVERALDDDASDPAPRHLDATLATALSWSVVIHESGELVGTPPGKAGTHLPVRIPAYSTSPKAMRGVEAEVIDRRGLGDAYLLCLGGGRACPEEVTVVELFRLLVGATPEQRARAAVRVLGAARP